MKRVIKCVSLVISLVCLVLFLSFPVVCLEYSDNVPNYVNEKGNFYIEVATSQIGAGTILLSNNYKFDYLSTYGSTEQLYNTTNSTISGYIYTTNNNYYQIRFTSLDTAQYYITGSGIGGNYGWQDLTITKLVSTNGSILGDNGIKVYSVSDSDKIIITILIVTVSLVLFGYVILLLFNRKGERY